MDVEITKLSGESFRLSEYDVYARDFIVESIEVIPNYSAVDGRNGRVDNGATYGGRGISVPFLYKAADMHDVALLRDELSGLTVDREPFYVRELRRLKYHPGHVYGDESEYGDRLIGGKRYLVRAASTFDVEQTALYGFGDLSFETTELPFAESVGTTADIEQYGISDERGIWGFGMGLISDDESLKYTHTAYSFRIYNAGNVSVCPFERDIKITVKGAASGYKLTNMTTGESFEYIGWESGELALDGAYVTMNGIQALRDTNRHFISLTPGWNEFTQNQAKEISFDFRFYYK